MRAIDAALAHYKANERKWMDVPEWVIEDKPMRVHWRLLTVAERVKLNEQGQNDVDVVVAKAQDAEGKVLFTLEDKPKLLLAADAMVLTRLSAAMLGQTRLSNAAVDDAIKN